jgi:hypothetical protein
MATAPLERMRRVIREKEQGGGAGAAVVERPSPHAGGVVAVQCRPHDSPRHPLRSPHPPSCSGLAVAAADRLAPYERQSCARLAHAAPLLGPGGVELRRDSSARVVEARSLQLVELAAGLSLPSPQVQHREEAGGVGGL